MKGIDATGVGEALAKAVDTIVQQPERAKAKNPPATAVLEAGLACRVNGSDTEIRTDMPRGLGGGAAAPTPGWYLRAALAACGATCIAMEAARRGIPLTRLEVTADSETDNRGLLGLDQSISAGMTNLRLRVTLSGLAAEAVLRDLAQSAVTRSPVGCTDPASAAVEVTVV